MVESALESSDSESELLVIGDNPPSMSLNLREEEQECLVAKQTKEYNVLIHKGHVASITDVK